MIRTSTTAGRARAFWYATGAVRSRNLDPVRVEDLQRRRLRALVEHAFARVPLYRDRFARSGIRPGDLREAGDLARLPILTKSELRQRPLSDRIAQGTDLTRCIGRRTSGTSGEPLLVYRDRRSVILFHALTARALFMAGARPTDKLLAIGPMYYPRNLPLQRLGLGRVKTVPPPQLPELLARAITEWQPDVLHAYGSVLKSLIAWRRSGGSIPHRPRVVVSSADLLDATTRRAVTAEIATEPVEMYGSVEAGRIGGECLSRQGIHVFTDWLVPEFVEAGADEEGPLYRVIVTDLSNFAMPLIRYDQGDLVRLYPEPCACGMHQPRIRLVGARGRDVVRLPGGDVVSALLLTTPWVYMAGVDAFQIVQVLPDRVTVRLLQDRAKRRDERIEAALRKTEARLPGVRVHVEFVDRIDPDASGKVVQFRSLCSGS
jgi:phenylacetate-CoA ligase